MVDQGDNSSVLFRVFSSIQSAIVKYKIRLNACSYSIYSFLITERKSMVKIDIKGFSQDS